MSTGNKTSSSLEQIVQRRMASDRAGFGCCFFHPLLLKIAHLELPRSVIALRKVQCMLKTLLTTINIRGITNMKMLSLNPQSVRYNFGEEFCI